MNEFIFIEYSEQDLECEFPFNVCYYCYLQHSNICILQAKLLQWGSLSLAKG